MCVCAQPGDLLTYTIRSIVAQKLPNNFSIRLIVADLDGSAARRGDIERICLAARLKHEYVPISGAGLAQARNHCLYIARNRWVAFIGATQLALDDWLAELVNRRSAHEAVIGVSEAVYDSGTVRPWLIAGDYHSRRAGASDAMLDAASNMLLDRVFLMANSIRFNEDFGHIEGDGALFLRELRDHGARVGFAAAATLYDPVRGERASLVWLLRRHFRAGTIDYLISRRSGQKLGATVAHAMVSLACTLLLLPLSPPLGRQLLASAHHCGKLAGIWGGPRSKDAG